MGVRNYYSGENTRLILEWSTLLLTMPDQGVLEMYVELLTYSIEEARAEEEEQIEDSS